MSKAQHTKTFSIIQKRRDDNEQDLVIAYGLTDREWANKVAEQHAIANGRDYFVQVWF